MPRRMQSRVIMPNQISTRFSYEEVGRREVKLDMGCVATRFSPPGLCEQSDCQGSHGSSSLDAIRPRAFPVAGSKWQGGLRPVERFIDCFYLIDDELGLTMCGCPPGSLPAADLFQRAMAGHTIAQAPDLLRTAGQCLCGYRKLGASATNRRRVVGEADSFSWDEFVRRFCPIFTDFAAGYHWSIDQCEYGTDIVFRRQADLAAIYENLTRRAISSVKPDRIATFLGKKPNGNY